MNIWYPEATSDDDMAKLMPFLMPFKVIRFMDAMKTNDSTVVSHDELMRPYTYTSGAWSEANRRPLSWCVDVANKCNSRGWFNIPHMMSVKDMAKTINYVCDNVNHRPIFEYTNEGWNHDFKQLAWLEQESRNKSLHRPALETIARKSSEIKTLVNGRGDVVAGMQFWAESTFGEFVDIGGMDCVDAIGIAPYIGRKIDSSVSDFAIYCKNEVKHDVKSQLSWYSGYRVFCYEIGWHGSVFAEKNKEKRPTLQDRMLCFSRSADMAEIEGELLDAVSDLEVVCPYAFAGKNAGQQWNHIEDVDGKWRVLPRYFAAATRLS